MNKQNLKEAQRALSSLGGKARAKKYSKKQLSEWAKKGTAVRMANKKAQKKKSG